MKFSKNIWKLLFLINPIINFFYYSFFVYFLVLYLLHKKLKFSLINKSIIFEFVFLQEKNINNKMTNQQNSSIYDDEFITENNEEKVLMDGKEIGILIHKHARGNNDVYHYWNAYLFIDEKDWQEDFAKKFDQRAKELEINIPFISFTGSTKFDNRWAIGWHHADDYLFGGIPAYQDKKSVIEEVQVLHGIFEKING